MAGEERAVAVRGRAGRVEGVRGVGVREREEAGGEGGWVAAWEVVGWGAWECWVEEMAEVHTLAHSRMGSGQGQRG